MNLGTYIDYLQMLLNIRNDNILVAVDMREELESISRLDEKAIIDFRFFVKKSLDKDELKYMTGLQKFFVLAKKFKNERMSYVKNNLETKAKKLSLKVATAFTNKTKEVLLQKRFLFRFVKSGGGDHFSKKELSILEKIDKKKVYTYLNQLGMLERYILDEYKKQADIFIDKKIHPSLPSVPGDPAIENLARKALA